MIKIISEMNTEYISDCAELYVDVFNAEPWNDKWTYETAYKRINDIFISPNFTGVLFIENQIRGAILGHREQWYKGLHFYLREIFVINELQGKGIGSVMLRALEDHLRGLDVNTIYLLTSKGNKTYEFYHKNGFVEWDSMTMMGKSI